MKRGLTSHGLFIVQSTDRAQLYGKFRWNNCW